MTDTGAGPAAVDLPSLLVRGGRWEQGTGRIERTACGVRLLRPGTTIAAYSNAQIGDQPGQRRWRPPATLRLRARFSHPLSQLRGTAGFGFWNHALSPGGGGLRPPRAAWFFFGGPPYDVPLALGVPGSGLTAMTIDAQRWPFFALLPTAPLAIFAMRVPALYRRLWPLAQRAIGVAEAPLNALDVTDWHEYVVRWEPTQVTFQVDDVMVLRTPRSPGGPLALVLWIDNSYAIATPQGRFGFGLVAEAVTQWLELETVEAASPWSCPR